MLEFFQQLWPGGIPPDQKLLIWTMPNKISRWFDSPEEAAEAAATLSGFDTYFGICLVSDPDAISRRKGQPASRVRGEAHDATHIPGLWADIDIAGGEGHKKSGLPTLDEALEVLARLQQPTLIVHTGGGLHVYWLFTEPQRIEDQGKWESIVAGWQEHIRSELGQLDSTWDLARVLRVPGSKNYKYEIEGGREVYVYREGGPRYSPEDFLGYAAAPRSVAPEVGRIRVDASNTGLDLARFEALMESDTKVKATWERRRTNLQDDSPSGYDMALASFAAGAGWDVQEITNLLVQWRIKHGLEPKREDYYRRTIERAVASADSSWQEEGPPERAVAALRSLWGVPITGLVQYTGDKPVYELEIEGYEPIMVGTANDLLRQDAFRAAVMNATGLVIPKQKQPVWDKHLAALMRAVRQVETGPESRDAEMLGEWADLYLSAHPAVEREEEPERYAQAVRRGEPVVHKNHVALTTSSFSVWLRLHTGAQWSSREIGAVMARSGWKTAKIDTPGRTGRTSRTYWLMEPIRARTRGAPILEKVTTEVTEATEQPI